MPNGNGTVRYKLNKRLATKLMPHANPTIGSSCLHALALKDTLRVLADQDTRWTQNGQTPRFEHGKKSNELYVAYIYDGFLYHKPLPADEFPNLNRSVDVFDAIQLGGKRGGAAKRTLRGIDNYEAVVLDPSKDILVSISGASSESATRSLANRKVKTGKAKADATARRILKRQRQRRLEDIATEVF